MTQTDNERSRRWRRNNRERENETRRKWYRNNREKERARCRKWGRDNPEKKREADRRRYWNNREEERERNRRWERDNPEKKREKYRRWARKNPEKKRESDRRWKKAHPERDRTVHAKVRGAINRYLRRAKAKPKAFRRSEDLLGYTMKDLENNLKRKIPKGYTWQDYVDGKLHLDHKIPISAFNITCAEDIAFKECWSLENLQLLPARDNLEKGGKVEGHFQPFLPLQIQPDSQKGTIPGK